MTAGDTVVALPSTVSWLRYVLMYKAMTDITGFQFCFFPSASFLALHMGRYSVHFFHLRWEGNKQKKESNNTLAPPFQKDKQLEMAKSKLSPFPESIPMVGSYLS